MCARKIINGPQNRQVCLFLRKDLRKEGATFRTTRHPAPCRHGKVCLAQQLRPYRCASALQNAYHAAVDLGLYHGDGYLPPPHLPRSLRGAGTEGVLHNFQQLATTCLSTPSTPNPMCYPESKQIPFIYQAKPKVMAGTTCSKRQRPNTGEFAASKACSKRQWFNVVLPFARRYQPRASKAGVRQVSSSGRMCGTTIAAVWGACLRPMSMYLRCVQATGAHWSWK